MATEAQRKFARRAVEKWRGRLFLGEWYISIIYSKIDADSGAYAECSASPKYLEATITIFPKFWKGPKARHEHTIVHELAHCHTAKASLMLDDALNGRLNSTKEIEYHIEQLTERIANICYQQSWVKK